MYIRGKIVHTRVVQVAWITNLYQNLKKLCRKFVSDSARNCSLTVNSGARHCLFDQEVEINMHVLFLKHCFLKGFVSLKKAI